jgi:hypothetical protein
MKPTLIESNFIPEKVMQTWILSIWDTLVATRDEWFPQFNKQNSARDNSNWNLKRKISLRASPHVSRTCRTSDKT